MEITVNVEKLRVKFIFHRKVFLTKARSAKNCAAD